MQSSPTPAFLLTSEQVAVVTDTFTSNLAIILPVALGLFAIGYALKNMPRIVKWFKG